MKPLLLKPILDKTIWGGNRLATIRNHPENIEHGGKCLLILTAVMK